MYELKTSNGKTKGKMCLGDLSLQTLQWIIISFYSYFLIYIYLYISFYIYFIPIYFFKQNVSLINKVSNK